MSAHVIFRSTSFNPKNTPCILSCKCIYGQKYARNNVVFSKRAKEKTKAVTQPGFEPGYDGYKGMPKLPLNHGVCHWASQIKVHYL